ncbi:hypothetical protein HK105_200915 [Polyrhizophydium stewartii]|uniref:Uncharacterized protein n=1 Tax=Polyrhizophydium stewartii TaxID=2732419 RepID=A0ABR4NID3_9FUNG
MVQGAVKKTKSVLASKAAKKVEPHRGRRIAPKSATVIEHKKMQKKLTAASIVATESLMAARAGATGKLTIMKSVAEKAQEKAKKAKDEKEAKKNRK